MRRDDLIECKANNPDKICRLTSNNRKRRKYDWNMWVLSSMRESETNVGLIAWR